MSPPLPAGPYDPPSEEEPGGPSFSDVRRSEAALDLLAARAPLGREDDGLLHLLAGWAAVVDAETEAATRPTGRGRAHGAGRDLAAAVAVRPVLPRRARRTPWWALSAGAAAVIAVMAVGLGAQDTGPAGPSTVAESVQSIEATLVAARLAAEQGDVAGARVLLERARELLSALPEEEQTALAGALVATEQGVVAAEAAVRSGQPLPPWPAVPGLPDPAASPAASRGPADAPSGRPSDAGRPDQPGGGQGRPDRTPPPAGTTAPAPTGTATGTPTTDAPPAGEPDPTTTAPAPAPTKTKTAPAPTPTKTKTASARPSASPTPAPTATGPGSRPTTATPPTAPPRVGATRTQGAAPTRTTTRTPPATGEAQAPGRPTGVSGDLAGDARGAGPGA